MDAFWLALGILLMLGGIAGSVLPFLPGPPLCFLGLWLQQLQAQPPYSNDFLWTWAAVTVGVTVIDYFIPVYGTKKFGGTKAGMWGCMIGLVGGFLLGPLGIIIGPFIGAFVGELISNSNSEQALKAAFGSFLGFLAGTLLKLITCFVMVYYFIEAF